MRKQAEGGTTVCAIRAFTSAIVWSAFFMDFWILCRGAVKLVVASSGISPAPLLVEEKVACSSYKLHICGTQMEPSQSHHQHGNVEVKLHFSLIK